MVERREYACVPTSVELESSGNHTKYTINKRYRSGIVISKFLCFLLIMGTVVLALLVGLLVYFLIPQCSNTTKFTKENGKHMSSHVDNDAPAAISEMSSSVDDIEINERLPSNLIPLHYTLELVPFLDNLTFNGKVSIAITANESTSKVILNAADLTILPTSITLVPIKSDEFISINDATKIDDQRYEISLLESLEANETYNLTIRYVGHLNLHLQGFYRSKYEAHNQTQYLASTQFSPTDARRAFPCFDEPSFKATFSISIAHPKELKALSNMPIEKTEEIEQGWLLDHFKETPKMPTYLVAFMVSNLEVVNTTDKNIQIWSRHDLLPYAEYAANVAPQILHFYETYFKSLFPLPKIDIVAVPEFGFSAMENWGLITFRENCLLYDMNADIDNKRDIATILGHEIGHQWFGNLVTPKWWDDLWLKEGFATYLQYLSVNQVESEWNFEEEFVLTETTAAFALDGFHSARPITFDVKNTKQIRQAFDKLSYSKGACIIRMMNHFLGEDTFKAGLITFLNKYKYSNADHKDLYKSLCEEAHKNNVLDPSMSVDDIMRTWTTQAGFPALTAIADYENQKITVTQERFFYNNNKSENIWWVPVSFTTSNEEEYNTKPAFWLRKQSSHTFDVNFNSSNSSSWYILNMEQTGYFIVNYDERNWRSLMKNIMNLPPLIRAQLISDSMDLARASLLTYDIPLKLIAKMALLDKDIMYVPTAIAFNKLSYLSDVLSTTSVFGLFEEYHSTIFKETYNLVNSDTNYFLDNYLQQKIRKLVLKWACRRKVSKCSVQAQHRFRNWMQRGIKYMVPPNLREVTYCTAIREGSDAEWKFAYESYLHTNSVSEKNVLLDALGCTTQKWRLTEYLDLMLNNSSIRIQDADRVFESVISNNVDSTLAFDFLREKWTELHNHFGEGFNIISKMVEKLPKYINTDYELSKLIEFRDLVSNNIGTAKQAFENAIETARANVKWMKDNYASVEKWLKDYKDHYGSLQSV